MKNVAGSVFLELHPTMTGLWPWCQTASKLKCSKFDSKQQVQLQIRNKAERHFPFIQNRVDSIVGKQ